MVELLIRQNQETLLLLLLSKKNLRRKKKKGGFNLYYRLLHTLLNWDDRIIEMILYPSSNAVPLSSVFFPLR